MTEPVIKTRDLPCAAARAFDVFVHQMASWWPLDRFAASVKFGKPALTVVVEPYVGGKITETMHDGASDVWGEVLVYDPPYNFAMTWHPGNNKDAPTRVDIRFEPLSAQTCRLTLTHSGWEIWGAQAAEMRQGYDSGWGMIVETCFEPAVGG